MPQTTCDFLIIGGGMAGASAGAHLAGAGRVVLLERESQPGYHSTGRSAALFSETYGNQPVRALSRASRDFLFSPQEGFSDYPLATPRGALHIAREDQREKLERFFGEADVAANAEPVSAEEVERLCPLLRKGYATAGAYEREARDVDVHGLHQGYLKALKRAGGALVVEAACRTLERTGGVWRAETGQGTFTAPIVINAAGAWADEIAILANVTPLNITPCRRTALLVDMPAGPGLGEMPLTIDMDEEFYFKPDAGKLLVSPADETPCAPGDVQSDEMDVAIAIDRVQSATTLQIARVFRKWAGLRSFAPDRSPVIGFDPHAEGFFWLAGQGGYGIQTAPAASRLAAALATGNPVPDDIAACGLSAAMVSPARFART
jgi:D-arginine dehydrogenase